MVGYNTDEILTEDGRRISKRKNASTFHQMVEVYCRQLNGQTGKARHSPFVRSVSFLRQTLRAT